jgi:membrane protease YdiL (CAAX protease family)
MNATLTHPAGAATGAALSIAHDASPRVHIAQLSRRAILGVWAAAAVPMAILSWVVAPIVASQLDGPAPLARALLVFLTVGLIWQFVLVAALVYREQRTLRWAVVRDVLWLRSPQSPRSGRRGGRVWLILPLLIAGFAAEQALPALPIPANRDFGLLLDSPAGHALFHGAWGWFALMLVLGVFNTVLGEELLFRGYLLPRMQGAFGRGDWIANGALFAGYHLHVPWVIPGALFDALVLAYPSRRYRSALIGIAVHSAQTVVISLLVLGVVL